MTERESGVPEPRLLGEHVTGETLQSREHIPEVEPAGQLGAAMAALMDPDQPVDPFDGFQPVPSNDQCKESQRSEYDRQMFIAGSEYGKICQSLDSEQKSLKINGAKVLTKWRIRLRQKQSDKLAAQLARLQASHEESMDTEEVRLHNDEVELANLDSQSSDAQRQHFVQMGQLITLHSKELNQISKEFSRDLQMLADEFEQERNQLLMTHNQECHQLQSVIQRGTEKENQETYSSKQTYETEREELRNRNLEDLNILKLSLEQEREVFEQKFDETHDRYIETTEKQNKEFSILKAKDESASRDIEKLMRKIENSSKELTILRRKRVASEKESKERNSSVKKERQELMQHYRDLKQKLNEFRKTQAERIENVSLAATKAKQTIQQRIDLGKKLVHFEDICSKLVNNQKDSELSKEQQSSEPLRKGDWELSRFMTVLNRSIISLESIRAKRRSAQKENDRLRSLLKTYLDGVSLNEEVMSKPNTLLMVASQEQPSINDALVSSQTLNPFRSGVSRARITHVSGAQAARNYQRQQVSGVIPQL